MIALRHLLLLTQSAAGAVVAAGSLVLALATHSPAAMALWLVTGACALVPLLIAGGLLAGWRRMQLIGITYETLLLGSGAMDAVILQNSDLVAILVNTLLPAAIICLLFRREATMEPWSGTASPAGSTGS